MGDIVGLQLRPCRARGGRGGIWSDLRDAIRSATERSIAAAIKILYPARSVRALVGGALATAFRVYAPVLFGGDKESGKTNEEPCGSSVPDAD